MLEGFKVIITEAETTKLAAVPTIIFTSFIVTLKAGIVGR
jgi:hypothetical protein